MKKYSLTLLCTLCCAFLLAACGPSNTITLVSPLEISPANQSEMRIALVKFEDKRGKNTLGVRLDKSHFFSADPVDKWFSTTLTDDLNKAGMNVHYVHSMAEAVKLNPQYILIGNIDELWMIEKSRTNMVAKIRAHFTLLKGDETVTQEIVRSERENSNIMFSSSASSKLFDDTMNDLCDVLVEKIRRVVK